ncbi:hypothetical protein J1N35_000750 [Gossypium stocksii]|uniref:Uncharacterized protein n=1 Tax=Gossypium stocksii TaxID=47602 RepID=A0A9D3WGB4_9ROSI|nr:hypothetical protein J1N35_000750 [Gossypium stocksii]
MGFRVCVGLMMMMILLKPIRGRDAVLVLSSNATYQCNGLLGGCGIREELESELDLLMIDSTVIRILQGGSDPVTKHVLDRHIPAVPCTGPYWKCIPKPPSVKPHRNCNVINNRYTDVRIMGEQMRGEEGKSRLGSFKWRGSHGVSILPIFFFFFKLFFVTCSVVVLASQEKNVGNKGCR